MSEPQNGALEAMTTINNAISNIRSTVHESDQHIIESTSRQDVSDAAREIESNQETNCNLPRVDYLLGSLDTFSKAAHLFCDETALSWTWASAIDPSVLNQLLSTYKRVGQAFPNLENFNSPEIPDSPLQQILAFCYADVLELHARCYKVFRSHGWEKFFAISWLRLQKRIKVVIDDLAECGRLLRGTLSIQDVINARENRRRVQQNIDEEEQKVTTNELNNALSWLKASKYDQGDELYNLLNRCHPGSCDWIHANPKIKSWIRNGREHSILWLKGIPGSGKSILCSKLVEKLESLKETTVLYFLCTATQPESLHCHSLLHALAAQLLQRQTDLAAVVQTEFFNKGHMSTARNVKELLLLILSAFPSVRIVLDGLDECEKKQQEDILKVMFDLVGHKNPSTTCKVLVSSQDIMTISNKLRMKTHIDLSQEHAAVESAIKSFVRAQVAQSRLFADAESLHMVDMTTIEQTLVSKAGGMFLWVYLVISMLEFAFSPQEVQQALQDLPEGLDKVYDRIFKRFRLDLPFSKKEQATRIFQWLAYSQRPLKRFELQHAVALHFENPKIDKNTMVFADVFELCKPLVEHGNGDTIRFVHVSVKEYIVQHRPLFNSEDAHCNIAYACVAYLLHHGVTLIESNYDDISRRIEIVGGMHGLCRYAVGHWVEHLLRFITSSSGHSHREEVLLAVDNLAITLARIAPQDITDCSRVKLDTRLEKLAERERETTYKLVVSALVSHLPQRIAPAKKKQNGKQGHPLFRILRAFDVISRELFQTDSVPGLEEKALHSFKQIYGTSILICRTSKCSRALIGFDSIDERDAHEATHQLRCPHAGCFNNRTGIRSQQDLKKHIAEAHPEDNEPKVPPSIVPFGEKRVDTNATLVGTPEPEPGYKAGKDAQNDLEESDVSDDEDETLSYGKLENVLTTDGFALRSTGWAL